MEFKLRPWDLRDLESLLKHANNWNIAKNLTDRFPHPYTENDGKAFLEFTATLKPVQIFAIEVNNEAVGSVGIILQTDIYVKNAELGYWLAEEYWSKGIITSVIKKTVEYAFENFDVVRIFSTTFGNNTASQRVLEKNGFSLEAKLDKTLYKKGEYLDECIYALRKK